MRGIISFNSPVILGITILAFGLLFLNIVTNDTINRLFAVRFSSWSDPMMYARLFTHTFVHQGMSHYSGNILLLLAVGPLVEEKYGSRNLLIMVLVTSAVIGLINVIFFKYTMLIGASGVVFMMILLASFTNINDGRIPFTVLLVGVIYIGNEIVNSFMYSDNISRMAHIIGGLTGAAFGAVLHWDQFSKNKH